MAENTDLVEITGLRFSLGYFQAKKFLSVDEIHKSLRRRKLNYAGEDMITYIERVRSDGFLSFPVEFPVTGLQHTTTRTAMMNILASQSFKGRNGDTAPREFGLRPELMDLSFWSADISSSHIEETRGAAYTYVQERRPGQAENYREEITQQFANSPAFNKSASPYGNFTFSLPLSDLLSLYGAQFCNGEKPQLSILGTDMYRLEIAHYLVVHPPDHFMDYPRVPSLKTRAEALPCVYWMGDTLYWRPQSTTDVLKVLTKEGEDKMYKVPDCDKYHCAWNLLTFAFHIPDGRALQIPAQTLTDNLSACDVLIPFLKDERIPKSIAEEVIVEVKKTQNRNFPASKKVEQ